MKSTGILFFGLLLLNISNYAISVIDDQFSTAPIETSIWEVRNTFLDSETYVSGGNAVLLNRGKLVTQNDLPENLIIQTRFKFSGNQNDVFRIVWRSDADDSNILNGAREMLNGVSFSAQRPHSENGYVGSIELGWSDHPNGNARLDWVSLDLGANLYHELRIEDIDGDIKIFLDGAPEPILTGSYDGRFGSKLSAYNREGIGGGSFISHGSQVKLDYLTIDAVSVSSTLPPWVNLALLAPLIRFLRK